MERLLLEAWINQTCLTTITAHGVEYRAIGIPWEVIGDMAEAGGVNTAHAPACSQDIPNMDQIWEAIIAHWVEAGVPVDETLGGWVDEWGEYILAHPVSETAS
jgi:hypothetical protein